MSSISDLAGYGNPLIMPEDTGHEGVKAKNPSDLFKVTTINKDGKLVNKLDVTNYAAKSVKPIVAGGQSLTDASIHQPSQHSDKTVVRPVDRGDEDELGRRLQNLGHTLAKYDFSSDPGFALKLTNKLLGSNLVSNNDAELIKMIPEDHRDDIMGAYNAVKNLITGTKKTSYDLLRLLVNPGGKLVQGKGLGSQMLATGLNKVASVIGNDAAKKEFEKSRGPIDLPDHRDKQVLQPLFDYGGPDQSGLGNVFKSGTKWYAKAAAAVANTAIKVVGNAIGLNKSKGIDPNKIINSSALGGIWDVPMIDETSSMDIRSDLSRDAYTYYNNPITGIRDPKDSLYNYLSNLNNEGLLTGYKTFAGFEIGSNHQWMIKIYPYPHDVTDKQTFTDLGRFTCVPPLPYYGLPNMWRGLDDISDNRNATLSTVNVVGKAKSKLTFKSAISKAAKAVAKSVTTSAKNWATDKYKALVEGNYDNDITKDQSSTTAYDRQFRLDRTGIHYISFGEYCPALSYDLNMGSPRTEDIKLFNGSSMQVMHGMQYNMTLNVSILDDVYHSMQKYMNQYYNCVYDLGGSAMAPYYACAFDIRLYIFRSGYQINHALKLIGIPIDYPIKHEGSQDPDESRVDITFSIIGAGRLPKTTVYPGSYPEVTIGYPKAEEVYYGTGSSNRMTDLKWNDIVVKTRGNKSNSKN